MDEQWILEREFKAEYSMWKRHTNTKKNCTTLLPMGVREIAHLGPVVFLAFTTNGTEVLSWALNALMKWNVETGIGTKQTGVAASLFKGVIQSRPKADLPKVSVHPPNGGGDFTCVCKSPDGKRMATGGEDGRVYLWKLKDL